MQHVITNILTLLGTKVFISIILFYNVCSYEFFLSSKLNQYRKSALSVLDLKRKITMFMSAMLAYILTRNLRNIAATIHERLVVINIINLSNIEFLRMCVILSRKDPEGVS